MSFSGVSIILLSAVALLSGCNNLTVQSVPPGAEIYLDGEPTGRVTPASFRLSDVGFGLHGIQARMAGYADSEIVGVEKIVAQGRIVLSVILPPVLIINLFRGFTVVKPGKVLLPLQPR